MVTGAGEALVRHDDPVVEIKNASDRGQACLFAAIQSGQNDDWPWSAPGLDRGLETPAGLGNNPSHRVPAVAA